MKRQIIHIDESKCNGCGLCIPNCPEGAIQLIDGKARLISDLFCDGLGACIGTCPEGAITIEEREAEPYDERKVMENIIRHGPNTIRAHLQHLKEHGEKEYLQMALSVLKEKNIPIDTQFIPSEPIQACPGSMAMPLCQSEPMSQAEVKEIPSALTHWPIQLHLISPMAPFFENADLLLVADCCAYASGDFHQKFLKGKKIAIACPKLDEGQEIYLTKLTALIDYAKINTLTVIFMEVPCCRGLLYLAQQAMANAQRKLPIKGIMLSRTGKILKEEYFGGVHENSY